LTGNQLDRRPAAVVGTTAASATRICPAGGLIVSVSTMLFWALATTAADAPNSRLADDIALTKSTISLLAAKDFAAVRDRLDLTMGQASDETLQKMSDVIGTSEPSSVETVWSTEDHNLETGDGSSRIMLEYGLTGKWVVVDAVVKTEAAAKRFTRLYFNINAQPLSELNAFHFFGKGPVQYLFLAGWIAVIGLTGLAMIVAFRRHTGWRRWTLVLLMPLGLTPTLSMNWNTATVWVLEAASNSAGYVIPFFALRYPMALLGYTEIGATYFYVSAPLIAFGYLIWHWRWSQR
jgi:hypothetical protein